MDEPNIFGWLLSLFQGEEPHWFVKILIGLAVGLSLPYIYRILKWPLLFFKEHVLKGEWWEYHYSTLNNIDRLYEASLRIKSSPSGTLVFRMLQEDTKLKYKGKVVMERGSDQFILLGRSQDQANEEHIIWRAHLPIKSKTEIITGVISSYNHDKKPYASIAILCNKRVGLPNAASLIDKAKIDTKDLPLLRVKKSVS